MMMSRVGSLHGSPLIHDRGGFNRAEVDEVKHFVYVDNLGVLSANRKAVESGLAELSESLTKEPSPSPRRDPARENQSFGR